MCDFLQGLVWTLGLAASAALGLYVAPAVEPVVAELGYWFGRGFEWIISLPGRALARARAGR